jgi:hypothetical protein
MIVGDLCDVPIGYFRPVSRDRMVKPIHQMSSSGP